ncbi:hypothetical protein [Urbifossiella limnaea]|uniref:Uncharacterized protein n=1 Tax=Urbifossiella limnaea TaxID=2528023 RepID=A0A517XRW0_9BACT|nr:hypothetical protein [Urbifossiella limnaea]QDU20245.1 hypothetical protein ETAA1_21900 [Urbifossiella limnaea]
MTTRVILPAVEAAALALTAAAQQRPVPPDPDRLVDVSLIRLIANPDAFDGKRVRVHGFVRVEHEGTSVYLHREDYVRALSRNGLWLAASDVAVPGSREAAVNNRYALIEGRFSAKMTGHRGMWSGAIQDITRMEPWDFDRDKK